MQKIYRMFQKTKFSLHFLTRKERFRLPNFINFQNYAVIRDNLMLYNKRSILKFHLRYLLNLLTRYLNIVEITFIFQTLKMQSEGRTSSHAGFFNLFLRILLINFPTVAHFTNMTKHVD